jgi:co-chaperonin GroES (HSP10)
MIVPYHDYVLIEPIVETKTVGGIALPSTLEDTATLRRGRVVRFGPGRRVVTMCDEHTVPLPFNVGDVVVYTRYAEQTVSNCGHVLVRESDIIGEEIGE